MLQQQLSDLRDYVLKYNPYLVTGYANAFIDDNVGIVNDDNNAIFPDDTKGDYFYLRLPNQITFSNQLEYNISDAVSGVGLSIDIYLIAYMLKADKDKLLANLVNTLRYYNNIKLTRCTNQTDVIILQELSKCNEVVIAKALQNCPQDAALISIFFTLNIPYDFKKLTCFTSPCFCS